MYFENLYVIKLNTFNYIEMKFLIFIIYNLIYLMHFPFF